MACIHKGEGTMRSSLKAVSTGCALIIALLWVVPAASAGPKEDVEEAASRWKAVLAENDPDKLLPLYTQDAVLWGTLSPKILSGPEALRGYFVAAFKALPNLKVTYGEQLIRVYGDTAVNSGYYTFSFVRDGETKTLPARYSFTYVKNGERWLVVDHHSSAMPAPPR
jgi:uncharacterized protein (TIGR02246 family)